MKVYINNYSKIKFGDYNHMNFEEFIINSFKDLKMKKYDAIIYVSKFSEELFEINNPGVFVSKLLDIKINNCFSFTDPVQGLKTGYNFIKNGVYKNILFIGMEKISHLKSSELETLISRLLPYREAEIGQTFYGHFAIKQRMYINRKKVNKNDIYKISVKNSKNGINNKFAQFQKEFTLKQVADSQIINDPIRLLETATFCDGISIMEISSRKCNLEIAQIIDSFDYSDITDINFQSIDNIIKKSGILSDIEVIELTDTVSFLQYYTESKLKLNKQCLINPSGGLKSSGNPIGATMIRQIIDTAKSLEDNKKTRGAAFYVNGVGDSSILTLINNHV